MPFFDRGLIAASQRVVGDLLTTDISEKQARSIKYQLSIAKLPLANNGHHRGYSLWR
ncbi:hypothetical protein IVB45_37765 (plasmid) [Bradyrhizobium sp. 4]|nr:hypothetical protein [Bradyrhizobium sp. 37]MCK1315879.1 hypothetical protein [Bradyrhizobium sp. 23]MCK1401398.1 hypothetical protein [Bradyrhizobium sp. 39]MCK1609198.1 hypothetical protein [Bradyrhizobium sp. 163]MCK1677890.1 hypothetical protein [Bradyrhizobium sp. 150]MCK1746414.1 hypothetical protein [Bradyrhizobium sp. 135]MCK1766412.1 hypothetical protein [Bradyrhizobium sp. 136]MCK1772902.1 hypothetical protein [Bradyrhizobium sp. 134]UPJ39269.1 hypothetical protein IVB45_37765 